MVFPDSVHAFWGKGKGGVCSFPEGTWDATNKTVLVAADRTNALAAEAARSDNNGKGIGADCSAYETVASPTHWFNVRKSAQRILYAMANGLGSLNGNPYKTTATVELKVNTELASGRNKYIDLNAKVKDAITTLAEGSEISGIVCKDKNTAPAAGIKLDAEKGQLSGTPTETGSFTLSYVIYVDGWCYIPVTVTVNIVD